MVLDTPIVDKKGEENDGGGIPPPATFILCITALIVPQMSEYNFETLHLMREELASLRQSAAEAPKRIRTPEPVRTFAIFGVIGAAEIDEGGWGRASTPRRTSSLVSQ